MTLAPESSLKRIQMRARDVEAGVPIEYLRLLHQGYEEFIDDISRSTPHIRVPWGRVPRHQVKLLMSWRKLLHVKALLGMLFGDQQLVKDHLKRC